MLLNIENLSFYSPCSTNVENEDDDCDDNSCC